MKQNRIIELNGYIEVPWEVTEEAFDSEWQNFLMENHWNFAGAVRELTEEELKYRAGQIEREETGREDAEKPAEEIGEAVPRLALELGREEDGIWLERRPNDFAEYESQVESLLSCSYHVIDFLPMRVDIAESDFYFEVEQFFMKEKELKAIARGFGRMILKLLCYFPFEVYTGEYEWQPGAQSAEIVKWIRTIVVGRSGELGILFPKENAFLLIQGGSLGMTVFNCSERVETVLAPLVWSEGFFWWEGEL